MASIGTSALDVNTIVSQLMQAEQRPLTRLDTREASYQAKLSAYGTLSSSIAAFQSSMNSLANPAALLALKASVSDTGVLTASAGSAAVPGSYAIEVTRLAQQQKLAAAGQTAVDAAIGNGTLTLQLGTISGGSLDSETGIYTGASFAAGTQAPVNLTIDAGNNTLSGIRDAINAANAGVTAAIVNDGGASPWRLVLTSVQTGAASSVKITVSGDAALSTLLAHNPAGTQNLSQKTAAQNAEFKVDGLAITKAGNSISDVISGVALNLAKANTGSTVTLSVDRDTASVQNLVKGFADAYNTLQKSLRSLASYDPSTKRGGPLQADGTTGIIASGVRSVLSASLAGAGRYTTLSQLGVAFQRDGTLAVDAAKLQAAMAAAPAEFAAAFSQSGRPTDSLITYTGASSATKAGSYAVNITQLATRGSSVGSAAANLTIDAGVNDALTVALDGLTANVTLTAGTYASASALALEVQTRINAASAFAAAGARITASSAGGVLTLASDRYGSASSVQVSGGNGAADLLGGAPVNTTGMNLAGSIGGVAATGSGQTLTGFAGSDAEGLQLAVSGGSTGNRGTVSYSRGFAYQLGKLAARYVESNGTIANRTDGIASSLKDIGRQRELLNTRLALLEKRYRTQFTTLDGVLSGMQSTQQYLTQQMDALASLATSSRN